MLKQHVCAGFCGGAASALSLDGVEITSCYPPTTNLCNIIIIKTKKT